MTSNDEKIEGPPDKKKPFFSASSEDVTGSSGGFGDMLGRRIGPYTAQLWFDNVQHNLAPVPGAFLLGMLGLSVAGIKLCKYS